MVYHFLLKMPVSVRPRCLSICFVCLIYVILSLAISSVLDAELISTADIAHASQKSMLAFRVSMEIWLSCLKLPFKDSFDA